ncbi:MAG: hypothetical protein AAGN35_09805 [Bacteroidota bacterium]
MQRINRILAFASVSFVLIFIAKINKVGLYTAYFKTIAEVEIRNSQDVKAGDLLLNQAFGLDAEREHRNSNFPSPALCEISANFSPYRKTLVPGVRPPTIFVPTRHFFRAVAPRAPTV